MPWLNSLSVAPLRMNIHSFIQKGDGGMLVKHPAKASQHFVRMPEQGSLKSCKELISSRAIALFAGGAQLATDTQSGHREHGMDKLNAKLIVKIKPHL